jgi:hypothetical protein
MLDEAEEQVTFHLKLLLKSPKLQKFEEKRCDPNLFGILNQLVQLIKALKTCSRTHQPDQLIKAREIKS